MMNVYANLRVFDHLVFCFNNNKTTKIFYSHYSGTTRSKKKIKNKKRGKKLQVKRGTKEGNNN